jgi:hypothetical protein
MRSEPDSWSARVIAASKPWARTASATAGVSVATTTRPSPASAARAATWAIIGRPAMSASGLPGRRVEAMRAGIRTRKDMRLGNFERRVEKWQKVSLVASL